MPAASWFLRKTEPDPVMSKRCSAPGTNLSRTMRRDPAGRIMPGHDLSPPGLRRGTIPAFYRKMQEMQRWHAYSQNTPSWLCFFIYVIILICYINEAMLCTYEKFFDLLFTTWRLRRRGMRLCTQVLPVIAGKFSLLSGINHKKKDGKGCHTFCCLRGGPQAKKAGTRGGGSRMAARAGGTAMPSLHGCGRLSAIKKGDRHMTVALVFSGEGRPTGPDPPARGSLPDLPGTCPDVPSGRAR